MKPVRIAFHLFLVAVVLLEFPASGWWIVAAALAGFCALGVGILLSVGSLLRCRRRH